MAMTIYTPKASPAVGAVLRRVRQEAGVSVAHMASATGHTEKQVRNWETGVSPTKRAIVLAWAVICDVDPDDLVLEVADTQRYRALLNTAA